PAKVHLIWTFGGRKRANPATNIRPRWLGKRRRGEPIRLRRCRFGSALGAVGSGSRNDRGALEGRGQPVRGMSLAGALEQHPPLESARTHEWETLEHLVAN